jgi:CHAT domain-containing protein
MKAHEGFTMRDQDVATAAELSQRAQGLLASGKFAEAAELFGRALDRLQTEKSDDVHLRAECARLRGNAFRELGDFEASITSLEHSISLLQNMSRTSEDDFTYANALRSVALTYDITGAAANATTARNKVLSIASRLVRLYAEPTTELVFDIAEDFEFLGKAEWEQPIEWLITISNQLDHSTALRALGKLHRLCTTGAKTATAARIAAKALDRIRSMDNRVLSDCFVEAHNIAWAAINSDIFDSTQELVTRLQEVAGSLDTGRLYQVRRLFAFLNYASGHTDEAADEFRAVHALALKCFGGEDSRTRASYRELGDILSALHRRDEAIEIYRTSLERETRIGSDRLVIADLAVALGRQLDDAGRFTEADENYRLALSIRTEILGPVHPDTNQARIDVAEISRVLDRYEEAEFFFLDALEAERRLTGTNTSRGALIRNNLADVYIKTERFSDARRLLEEALAIRSELFGSDSEPAWRSRVSLAALERDAGNTSRAIELAHSGIKRQYHSQDAIWQLILAGALLKQGDTEAAEKVYVRLHRAISANDIGRFVSMEAYLEIMEGLTLCHISKQHWAEAATIASEVVREIQLHLIRVVQQSSATQLTRFARRIGSIQSLWLLALTRWTNADAENVAAAFGLVQLSKGLRTRYLRWRQPGVGNVEHIAPPGHDEKISELINEIRQLRDELTSEFFKVDDVDEFGGSRAVVAKRARLCQLERVLSGFIPDWKMDFDLIPIDSGSLLRPNTMALEFVLIHDVVADLTGQKPAAARYVAFVLGPNGNSGPELIDLGLSDDIDQAVNEMRDSLLGQSWVDGGREPKWLRVSRFLGHKLFMRCWTSIKSVQHLLIVPDGSLGLIPFEILVTPESGYLIDHVRVSYLMRFGELNNIRVVQYLDGEPLVLAGPNFDLPKAYQAARTGQCGAEYVLARALGGDKRFDPLPEAHNEGVAVAQLLDVEPLVNVWALAPELLRSRSPEIMHVSTHGFCLPLEASLDDRLPLGGLGNAIDRRMVLTDPMQRSGLAMSGVNAVLDGRSLPPEAGEGVIYGSEIQQLNLQHTDLVVLSACRSGLGDIEIGDGAQGLRRAFLAAGCGSVVSALWDVPEVSARKFMERFYQELLKGTERMQALSQARESVRAEYPRDPIHWAGFVLDGNFGPLWRFSPVSKIKIASVNLSSWGSTGSADIDNMTNLAERITQGRSFNEKNVSVLTVTYLRRVLREHDLNPELRVVALGELGDLANRLGDNEAAIIYYRTILGLKGLASEQRVEYRYNIAKILQQMEQHEKAIAEYTALLNDPRSEEFVSLIRVNRGVALFDTGRVADAVSDFTAVIMDPSSPIDQRFMAYSNRSVALEINDPARALSDVEAALAINIGDEIEKLKLRFIRIAALLQLDQRQLALHEISDLEGHPDIADEFREQLGELRAEALQGCKLSFGKPRLS